MTSRPDPDRDLLKAEDVMVLVGCSRSFVTRHRAELGGRKTGNMLRFPRAAVLAFGTPIAEPAPAATPAPTPIHRTPASKREGVGLVTGKPPGYWTDLAAQEAAR